MINWGKNQNPKKSLVLPTKPTKISGPKINPPKNPMSNFQALKFPERIT